MQNAPAKGSVIAGNEPEADLPFASGKSFATLDAYLEHLRELGTTDVPYYLKRADGRFVYIAGRVRPGPNDIYTREQLLERFGFEK